jgi:CRISPR type I-E-associated protein CasB/Cse2
MPPEAPPEAATAEPRLGQVLARIAANLTPEALGTGPLAMLRRLDPSRASAEPALHKLLARHVPDARVDRDGLATWALLVHAMALAAPGGMRLGAGLGGPLFAADYKEGRLTRLLEARAEDLAVTVPRAVRFLVAHGEPLDPMALARFVLDVTAGGKRAEVQRTEVARDYYRAERAANAA